MHCSVPQAKRSKKKKPKPTDNNNSSTKLSKVTALANVTAAFQDAGERQKEQDTSHSDGARRAVEGADTPLFRLVSNNIMRAKYVHN